MRFYFTITLSLYTLYFFLLSFWKYHFYLSGVFEGDVSIYSQAMGLLNGNNLNPSVSIRQLKIFNDHFDPIIIPFALTFAKVFPPTLVGEVIKVGSIVLSVIIIFIYMSKKRYPSSAVVLVLLFFLFNRGTIEAIYNTINPVIWSIFPITLLGIAWMEKRFGWILLALLFLFCFKEEFPFIGMMVGMWYLYKRQYREASIILIVSMAWFLFTRNRDLFFEGFIFNYGGDMFYKLFHDPKQLFETGQLRKPLSNFIATLMAIVVPLLYVMYRKRGIQLDVSLLFFSTPILLIRMFGRGFMYLFVEKYFIPLSSLWGMFLLSNLKGVSFPRWFIMGYFIFLSLFNVDDFWKNTSIITNVIERYDVYEERRREMEKWVSFLKQKEPVNLFTYNYLGQYFYDNPHVFNFFWYSKEGNSQTDVSIQPERGKEDYLILDKKDFLGKVRDARDGFDSPFVREFLKTAVIIEDNKYILVAKRPPR